MDRQEPHRILILGGGFGGIYTALHLERTVGADPGVQITLVNRDNYFLFTPMLHEVAASDIDIAHIANPIRKLLKRTRFFHGTVEHVDLDRRRVTVSHGPHHHTHALGYDQLVIALGSTTNFYGLPGLAERAVAMKRLDDAVALRHRLIEHLESAATECAAGVRGPLLTVLVAGGGFAGVETVAAVNDFVREALEHYPLIEASSVRMVLVHPGDAILPELDASLGRYARAQLEARGVEVRLNCKVTGATDAGVTLSDGSLVPTGLVVWTAGTAPPPLLDVLPCRRERGRIVVDSTLAVPGYPGVWALGDCAMVPDPRTGEPYPPTAQHALRQGKVAAHNIVATLRGGEMESFVFSSLGQLAAIGRRTGVANIFGRNCAGFAAWWLWRTVYLSKLPRLEKKIRVALDWTLDLLFAKDLVQYGAAPPPTLPRELPTSAPVPADAVAGAPMAVAVAVAVDRA